MGRRKKVQNIDKVDNKRGKGIRDCSPRYLVGYEGGKG